MNEKIFIEKARELVYEYTNDNRISVDDVYVVWKLQKLYKITKHYYQHQ